MSWTPLCSICKYSLGKGDKTAEQKVTGGHLPVGNFYKGYVCHCCEPIFESKGGTIADIEDEFLQKMPSITQNPFSKKISEQVLYYIIKDSESAREASALAREGQSASEWDPLR